MSLGRLAGPGDVDASRDLVSRRDRLRDRLFRLLISADIFSRAVIRDLIYGGSEKSALEVDELTAEISFDESPSTTLSANLANAWSDWSCDTARIALASGGRWLNQMVFRRLSFIVRPSLASRLSIFKRCEGF